MPQSILLLDEFLLIQYFNILIPLVLSLKQNLCDQFLFFPFHHLHLWLVFFLDFSCFSIEIDPFSSDACEERFCNFIDLRCFSITQKDLNILVQNMVCVILCNPSFSLQTLDTILTNTRMLRFPWHTHTRPLVDLKKKKTQTTRTNL